MSEKEKIPTVEVSDDELLKIIRKVPMRAICGKAELEYNMKTEHSVADKLAMFQYLINTHRIFEKGERTQKMCQVLYAQGVLFDHTKAAIADDDENEEANRKRTKEEIMAEPTKKKKGKKDFLDMWLAPAKKGTRYDV